MVTFKNVKGSVELNGCKPKKVHVIDPYSFSIGDTFEISNYVDGGEFIQIKKTKTLGFRSLQEALNTPEFVISDFAKMDRLPTTHLGFISLSTFHIQYHRLPRPQSEVSFFLSRSCFHFYHNHPLVILILVGFSITIENRQELFNENECSLVKSGRY